MPIEFVIRIETYNNSPDAWKGFYKAIFHALEDFLMLPFSIHDYGDYICEQFELSPKEYKQILETEKMMKE